MELPTTGGVAIQIQGAGDVTVGGIDATNAAGNVEIKSAANIVLNDVDGGATTGTVYLEAGDSITDANGNTVNVSADNLNLVAVNDATLNTNVATLDFSGRAITISESDDIDIAASSATGALSITAGGPITQSVRLMPIPQPVLSAGGNVITLNSEANDFTGAVSLTNTGTNNVTIDDANDLVLGTVSIAAGNLNVDNAGTITQNGVVSVGGNTVLDNSDGDNADITLANESNVFTGTVTFTTDTGSDISIADTTAFDLGALAVNRLIGVSGWRYNRQRSPGYRHYRIFYHHCGERKCCLGSGK